MLNRRELNRWLLLGAACPAGLSASSPGAADEEEVRAFVHSFFDLLQRRDWDAVGRRFADDFVLYTDQAAVFPKGAYVDLLKQDDLVVESWKLDGLEVRVSADGSTAWSRYRGSFRCTSHGQRADAETAETLVLRRGQASWVIVHAHASVRSTD